jgi:hypothetical protein
MQVEAMRHVLDKALPSGDIGATGGPIIKDLYYGHIATLCEIIINLPTNDPAFASTNKAHIMWVICNIMVYMANGKLGHATEAIMELGEKMGPVITGTGAYAFFVSQLHRE